MIRAGLGRGDIEEVALGLVAVETDLEGIEEQTQIVGIVEQAARRHLLREDVFQNIKQPPLKRLPAIVQGPSLHHDGNPHGLGLHDDALLCAAKE